MVIRVGAWVGASAKLGKSFLEAAPHSVGLNDPVHRPRGYAGAGKVLTNFESFVEPVGGLIMPELEAAFYESDPFRVAHVHCDTPPTGFHSPAPGLSAQAYDHVLAVLGRTIAYLRYEEFDVIVTGRMFATHTARSPYGVLDSHGFRWDTGDLGTGLLAWDPRRLLKTQVDYFESRPRSGRTSQGFVATFERS